MNGDGYADVVVGAPDYDEQTGARPTSTTVRRPACEPVADWTAEGEQAGDRLWLLRGHGRGRERRRLCRPRRRRPWRDNWTGAGAYVYHGSALGLDAPSRTFSGEDAARPVWLSSVGTAGDVNGDGYADLVVGASVSTARGRAYVYHGSARGPQSDHGWAPPAKTMGTGLAGPWHGGGRERRRLRRRRHRCAAPRTAHAGKAYVYHGNDGGGRLAWPARPAATAAACRYSPGGPPTRRQLPASRCTPSIPLGPGKARLQVQACPPACPLATRPAWTLSQISWNRGRGTKMAWRWQRPSRGWTGGHPLPLAGARSLRLAHL